MSGESPVVELYDSTGNPLAVQDGVAIPASTPGLLSMGSDGTNSRYITIDSSGRQIVVGAGTAGTPSGGVITVQGVNGGTPLPISSISNVDAGNSSTTPLAGNGTFSGTGIDVSNYGVISVFVFADQAGTLNIEFSTNNTNWDDINSYAVSASTALSVQFGPQARFFRVVYQNGSSAQSVFRLQTIEKPITSFPETVPVSYVVNAADDAILTKSVITGKTTAGGGSYVDVKVNPSGTLTVDASGSTVTANIGTTGGLALDATLTGGTQTTRITDGTNTATVKAASTAAVAADKALVVAVSPNNIVSTTNASIGTNNTTIPSSSTLIGGSDNINITRPIKVDKSGNVQVDIADSANVSAFGRVRASNPLAIFSNKQIFDSQPLYWDDQQTSGASTSSAFQSNKAETLMTVTNNVAGTRVRQSFRRMNYQPGKSQLCLFTGVLVNEGGTGNAAVNRRIGLFDSNNGFYFELTGTTMNVGIRTFTSGSAVSTLTPQSSWNIDKLDGTGESGFTLDVSKAQIFVIDFQWLGTGRIRYGFDLNGVIIYCHQTVVANNQSLVSISNPNLPVRYEIQSLGTGAATTSSLAHICASIISEGGQEDVGFTYGVDMGAASITTGNNTNTYTLLAIQLQNGFMSATIEPTFFSVVSGTANAQFKVALILNPTVAGTALSYTPVTNSALQFAVGVANNTITGGTIIYSGYFQSNKSNSATDKLSIDVSLGSSIAGVSDTIVLAVQPTPSAALLFLGSLNWKEQI